MTPQPPINIAQLSLKLYQLALEHRLVAQNITRNPVPITIEGMDYRTGPNGLLLTDPETLTTVYLTPVITSLRDTHTHYLYCQRPDGSHSLITARSIRSAFSTLFDEPKEVR